MHRDGKKQRWPSHYMKVLDERSSIKKSVSVSIQLSVSSLKIFQFSGIMVFAYFCCGVCLETFVILHSLHSHYIFTGSWRWRRQQSAGKRKVGLQQCTQALIAASTASAVEKLLIVGTRRLLYITHRTFQPYHWWPRKLWNKLDCSRLARNLNNDLQQLWGFSNTEAQSAPIIADSLCGRKPNTAKLKQDRPVAGSCRYRPSISPVPGLNTVNVNIRSRVARTRIYWAEHGT